MERIVATANADTRRTDLVYVMESGRIASIGCNGKRWTLPEPIEVRAGDTIMVKWDPNAPTVKVTTVRCSEGGVTCSVGRDGE